MANSKFNNKVKIELAEDKKEKKTKVKSTKAKSSAKSSIKSGGSKKSKSTKKSTRKPKAESQSIKDLRNYLEQRVMQANRLAEDVDSGVYGNLEDILANARRTLPPTRKKDEELFTSNIKSEKAMMREIARMDVFEASLRNSSNDNYEQIVSSKLTNGVTSQIEEMRVNFYKGAFGGQYMKNNPDHEAYDKSRINEDFAEKAFGLYHRLVEKYQSEDFLRMLWSRDSRVTYGSESVIIAIYDMVSQGYHSDEDIMDKMSSEIESRYKEIQDMDRRFKTHADYNRFKR